MARPVPQWKSRGHLEDHFRRHRRLLGVRTVGEYDASARETMTVGTFFEYRTGARWRVGYYDRGTGRLTILTDDQAEIVTHYRCPERYVETLDGSTYA